MVGRDHVVVDKIKTSPRRAELRLRAELSTAASAATVLLLSLVSRPDADSDRIADSDSSHPKSSTFLSWPPLGDSRCSFRCAPGCLCPWRVLYGPDAPGEDRRPGRLEDPGGCPGLREDPEDPGRLRRAAKFTPIYDLNSY